MFLSKKMCIKIYINLIIIYIEFYKVVFTQTIFLTTVFFLQKNWPGGCRTGPECCILAPPPALDGTGAVLLTIRRRLGSSNVLGRSPKALSKRKIQASMLYNPEFTRKIRLMPLYQRPRIIYVYVNGR